MSSSTRISVVCGWLVSLIVSAGVSAQATGQFNANFQPIFEFSRTSSEPIIEYNLIQHMLAEPDPQPLLLIYGNGKARVHFPRYMKRAGDYELQLSRSELTALLRSLALDGIVEFDQLAARQNKQQLEAQQRSATGLLYSVSDVAETVIRIRLEGYQRGPAFKRITNLERRFSWNNLEHDAKRHPQSEAIRRAAAGAQRLHGFLGRSDLRRIR